MRPAPPAIRNTCWRLVAPGFTSRRSLATTSACWVTWYIEDTMAGLRAQGIQKLRAVSSTLEEARQPAIVDRHGRRVGVLSYNCVGPRDSWAGVSTAGCAYIYVITHYELDHASPGGPPRIYTFAEPDTLEAMQADIDALAAESTSITSWLAQGDRVIRAELAQYERPLADAAIDAGADVVVGHHAHITRGVEVYRAARVPRHRPLRDSHASAQRRGECQPGAPGLGEAAHGALRLRARPRLSHLSIPS